MAEVRPIVSGRMVGEADPFGEPGSAACAGPARLHGPVSRPWLTVIFLFAAYLLSMLDRTILSLMVGPIQADLKISDTQFGLLQGLAFAICYSLASLPIGWLVDRASRRTIISGGVALWSAMTVFSGLAKGFAQLFVARVGVGIGEASLNPAAYSMLADLFSGQRLARAIAIFSTGATVGAGLAYAFGGGLLQILGARPEVVLPLVGGIRTWQVAFLFVGAPGLLLAVLILTLPEPRRPVLHSSDDHAWRALGLVLRRRALAFGLPTLAFSCMTLVNYAVWGWAPALLLRKHGFSSAQVGAAMGIAVGVFGALGTVLGGALTDSWKRQGRADAPMRAGLLGMIAALPFSIGLALLHDSLAVVACLCGAVAALASTSPGAMAGLQLITPPAQRGRISALFLIIVNLVGVGLGPLVVALLTDDVFRSKAAIHLSIAWVAAIFLPLGGLLFALCLKPFREAVAD